MKHNLCDNVNAAQVIATKFVAKFLSFRRLECRQLCDTRSLKTGRRRSGLTPRGCGYRSSIISEDMLRVSCLMVFFDAQESTP